MGGDCIMEQTPMDEKGSGKAWNQTAKTKVSAGCGADNHELLFPDS
jgi:hypothetical protein